MMRKQNVEKAKKAVKALAEGISYTDAAKRFGVSTGTLRAWKKQLGTTGTTTTTTTTRGRRTATPNAIRNRRQVTGTRTNAIQRDQILRDIGEYFIKSVNHLIAG